MKIERQTSTEQESIKAEYNVEQVMCKNSFLKESVSQNHSGLWYSQDEVKWTYPVVTNALVF